MTNTLQVIHNRQSHIERGNYLHLQNEMKKNEYRVAGLAQLRDLDKLSREMQQADVPVIQSKFNKYWTMARTMMMGILFLGIMYQEVLPRLGIKMGRR